MNRCFRMEGQANTACSRPLRARANGAAAASIRLLASGSQGSPPANKRMEPSSVQSASVLSAGGSSAAPLDGQS
jgi:hypothetical protein